MKLFTNDLKESDIRAALSFAKDHGHVAKDVEFSVLAFIGQSRLGKQYEIRLGSNTKSIDPNTEKPRRTSSTQDNGYRYGATYYEWGWVLSDIYDRDPEVVIRAFYGNYDNGSDFHEKTNYQFS